MLALLGETLVFGGSAEAAGLKLVANGVLGDSLASLRRALARGDALGLPRDAVLDVVGRGVAGPVRRRQARRPRPRGGTAAGDVRRGRARQGPRPARRPPTDTVVRLRDGPGHPDRRRRARGRTTTSASSASRPRTCPGWPTPASTSRPRSSPTRRAAPAARLRPAPTPPATRAHLADAFLPTAHVEGYRDGEFVSWALEAFRRRLLRLARRRRGHPVPPHRAPRRPGRRRHRRDDAAPRRGRLHRRVRAPTRSGIGEWRIANKAYERWAAGR